MGDIIDVVLSHSLYHSLSKDVTDIIFDYCDEIKLKSINLKKKLNIFFKSRESYDENYGIFSSNSFDDLIRYNKYYDCCGLWDIDHDLKLNIEEIIHYIFDIMIDCA